jgi:hypothetical protein
MPFVWGPEQVASMCALQTALTTAPALCPVNYKEDAGLIILAVDASKRGWGAVLQQETDAGKRCPCRYESGIWSVSEQKYNAVKA